MRELVTKSTSFGPSAGTADTESTIGSKYSFGGSGRIKQIRVAFYNGVIDKSDAAILYLYFKKAPGPFEFAVGGQTSIDTTSGSRGAKPTELIDVDIAYAVGEEVTVKLKGAEATEEVTISLLLIE